ncbi:MAG: hypothetical protein K2K26_01865 [Muribaculaceae bacterium]|nr:hypothetical protein [Muribaculaceae bacterium]
MRITLSPLLLIFVTIASGCGHTNTAPVSTPSPIPYNDTLQSPPPHISDSLIPTHKDTLPLPPTHAISSPPTSEELNRISDTISNHFQSLASSHPLRQNLNSWCTTSDSIIIFLNINTPYWQNQCRKYLSTSPYIAFQGPSQPEKITIIPTITDSIILCPDQLSYSADSPTISFTLTNNTHSTLTFGDPYTVAYRSTDGTWYKLPDRAIWNDIGYALQTGGSHTFTVNLRPQLNHNTPGVYRLYKKVWSEDYSQPLWIMTEFHLH